MCGLQATAVKMHVYNPYTGEMIRLKAQIKIKELAFGLSLACAHTTLNIA